jgi:hypothetical protein
MRPAGEVAAEAKVTAEEREMAAGAVAGEMAVAVHETEVAKVMAVVVHAMAEGAAEAVDAGEAKEMAGAAEAAANATKQELFAVLAFSDQLSSRTFSQAIVSHKTLSRARLQQLRSLLRSLAFRDHVRHQFECVSYVFRCFRIPLEKDHGCLLIGPWKKMNEASYNNCIYIVGSCNWARRTSMDLRDS